MKMMGNAAKNGTMPMETSGCQSGPVDFNFEFDVPITHKGST
jgi:hypothetical protein